MMLLISIYDLVASGGLAYTGPAVWSHFSSHNFASTSVI